MTDAQFSAAPEVDLRGHCSIAEINFAWLLTKRELLDEYADECRIDGLPPVNPHWPLYETLEASGVYRVFGAYKDGKMVGFAGVLTTVNAHYSEMMATVESLFVSKAARDGSVPARLMGAIETHAAARGCVGILYSALAGSALEAVLGKRYSRTNAVFFKPLGSVAGIAGEDQGGGRPHFDAAAG